MTILEAIRQRHSVRSFSLRLLDRVAVAQLKFEIDDCNKQFDLNFQLITDEPEAFSGFPAHYGKFSGVRNYIALVGKKRSGLLQDCGYCGERLVIKAQSLGLNSCWVGLTYSKRKARIQIAPDEKLVCVIALGYGTSSGSAHKSRPVEDLCEAYEPMPPWFRRGMEAAALAPTAINQQKFRFLLTDTNQVKAKTLPGPFSRVDLGIACYHFEQGAGKENFSWAN